MAYKTYREARAQLPAGATWSCSFGYPGEGGYVECWRLPDGVRWDIKNGAWDDGHAWTCAPRPLSPATLAKLEAEQDAWLEDDARRAPSPGAGALLP